MLSTVARAASRIARRSGVAQLRSEGAEGRSKKRTQKVLSRMMVVRKSVLGCKRRATKEQCSHKTSVYDPCEATHPVESAAARGPSVGVDVQVERRRWWIARRTRLPRL